MRKLFNLCLLGAVAIFASACGSGTTNAERGLVLAADKNVIADDGIDAVQFTVKNEGKDVTAEVEYLDGTTVMTGVVGGKFTSSVVKEYRVRARYNGELSNQVIVTVKEKAFTKEATMLYFTATWCIWCPLGVGRVMACEEAYPDRVNSLFFHELRKGEEYEPLEIFNIDATFDMESWIGGIGGLPGVKVDNDYSFSHQTGEPANLVQSLEKGEYVGSCGLAIDSKLVGDKMTATVRFKNEDSKLLDKDLRMVVWVTEDGLVYKQARGFEKDPSKEPELVEPYTHNRVVRACISINEVDGNYKGVEVPAAGKAIGGEFTQDFEYTVPAATAERPNDFNTANMHVVAYVYLKEGPQTSLHTILNSQKVAFGKAVDYQYSVQ